MFPFSKRNDPMAVTVFSRDDMGSTVLHPAAEFGNYNTLLSACFLYCLKFCICLNLESPSVRFGQIVAMGYFIRKNKIQLRGNKWWL